MSIHANVGVDAHDTHDIHKEHDTAWHTHKHIQHTRDDYDYDYDYDYDHDNDNNDDYGNDNDNGHDEDAQPILMENAPVPHANDRVSTSPHVNTHGPTDSSKMKDLSVGLSENLYFVEKSSSSCSPIREMPLKTGEMLEMTSASSGSLKAVNQKMKDLSVGPQRSDEPPNPPTPRDLKTLGNHYSTQNLQTPTFTDDLQESTQKIKDLSVGSQRSPVDETAPRIKFVDLHW